MSTLQDELDRIIRPVVEGMNFEFVGLRYLPQGKYSLLRVYIDSVSLDECSEISHQISGVLDVEDIISSNYTLEVSSPGIDRPLFNIKHYQQFIESEVKLNLKTILDGKRKISGVIVSADDKGIIEIKDEKNNKLWVLKIEQIDKANIIAKIDWNK